MMKPLGILSLACATALTIACGGNNDRSDIAVNNDTTTANDRVGTTGETAFSAGDRDFIEDSMEAGMAEVELGKMAAERGQSADVKRFAQMMVTDHTRAGDELKQATSQYNFAPAISISEKHRDLQSKLATLQGAEFDREYMSAMVDGHQGVVDHLESRVDDKALGEWKTKHKDPHTHDTVTAKVEAETIVPEKSDNPATFAVNTWAAKTLPVAEDHLQQAKALKDKLDERRRNATN